MNVDEIWIGYSGCDNRIMQVIMNVRMIGYSGCDNRIMQVIMNVRMRF